MSCWRPCYECRVPAPTLGLLHRIPNPVYTNMTWNMALHAWPSHSDSSYKDCEVPLQLNLESFPGNSHPEKWRSKRSQTRRHRTWICSPWGGGRPVNFWCLKAGGFLKQELSMERWILWWIFFWSQNTKEKSAKKIRRKIRRLESKNPPGVNPPWDPFTEPPPPPHSLSPPLGERLQVLSLRVWDSLHLSVSAAGLCEAPLLVEVHILLHNQSLEGCIRSSGQVPNEERMQLSQGLAMASQRCMHCQFLVLKFGPWILKKKSAVRLCKTWQDKSLLFFLIRGGNPPEKIHPN